MNNPVAQIVVKLGHRNLDRVGDAAVAAVVLIVTASLVFFADTLLFKGKEETRHRSAEKGRQGKPGARIKILQLFEEDPPQAFLMEAPMPIPVVIKGQVKEVVIKRQVEERLELFPQRLLLPFPPAHGNRHQPLIHHLEKAKTTPCIQQMLNDTALREAIDIIGVHTMGRLNGVTMPAESKALMAAMHKPFWNTEQHFGTHAGEGPDR